MANEYSLSMPYCARPIKIRWHPEQILADRYRLLRRLWPLTLPKAYPWAAAVFVDELDAGSFQTFATIISVF